MLHGLSAGSPRQLAWLPVLIVLPLFALLMLGVRLTVLPEIERSTHSDLQRRTAVLAERIRAQLGNQLRELRQLARSPVLRDAHRDPAAARAELDWLLQHQTAFVWIGLVAPDGKVMAGTQGWLEGESVAQRPIFARAMQDGGFLGDFHTKLPLRPLMAGRADADDEVFDIALRLDDAQGRPLAVLAAHVGSRWLRDLEGHALRGLAHAGGPRAHLLIGQPPREILGDLAADFAGGRAGASGAAAGAAALSPAWLAWAAADGVAAPPENALASLQKVDTPVPGGAQALPWRVLVLRDRSEAQEPACRLMGAIGPLGLLAAALLGASGYWAARRLTRPWQALIDAAAASPGSPAAPLGPYADVVHDALARGPRQAGRPAWPLEAADAVLLRLAADARYTKRVLDHLPVGVVLSGRAFEIEYVNTTFTRQLGLRAEAVRGQLDGQFLCYPSDAAALAAQLHAMAAAPGELAARFVARQADGSPRAVQWHMVPLFDAAGSFDGAISVVTDIDAETTARRRAAALDQRLRLLLEVAIDHALVLLDEEGRILSWNVGATQVFGQPAAQATGRGFEDLFESEACAAGLPQRLLAQARAQGRVPIDGPQRHASGKPLHVAGSLYAMPPQAWPAAYALILRDVTSGLQAERALARYQQDLAGLAQRLLEQEKETTRRLAQTLHDELGQTLTAMRLTFDACRSAFPAAGPMAERIGRLQGLIIDGNHQVRRALVELRPPLLDDMGLVPALRNELALRGAAHPETELRLELVPALEEQRWPAAVEYAAFMVAREAVLNALQHGRAAAVMLHLEGHASELRLAVLDDGIGLPPGDNLRPGHLGLVGMRERALAIGAELTLAARPEGGTVVTMTWNELEQTGQGGCG